VVCRCVRSRNLVNEVGQAHWGLLRQKKKERTFNKIITIFRIQNGLQMDHRTHCFSHYQHPGLHDVCILLRFRRVFAAVGTDSVRSKHQRPNRQFASVRCRRQPLQPTLYRGKKTFTWSTKCSHTDRHFGSVNTHKNTYCRPTDPVFMCI